MHGENRVMSKLLSVSIAAYNVESTIEQCLDSFLPSKYLDELELLVVNDGSHDRTVEIVEQYVQKYPNVIRLINKKNGGHGSTINASLKSATGKFYKVLDGDDWVNVKELDKLMEYLKQTDADLVINGFKWCYPDHSYEQHDEKFFKIHYTYSFEEMCRIYQKPFFMHAITIRTECLKKANMHIKEKCFYADNEFNMFAYLSAETVAFDTSCAYQYRMGNSSQSVSDEGYFKHLEDLFKIFIDMVDTYDEQKNKIKNIGKREYIFHILESMYNGLFVTLTGRISKKDKDYLILDLMKYMKENHADLQKQFHLSRRNQLISLSPALGIPFMRKFRKTAIFKVMRMMKHKMQKATEH